MMDCILQILFIWGSVQQEHSRNYFTLCLGATERRSLQPRASVTQNIQGEWKGFTPFIHKETNKQTTKQIATNFAILCNSAILNIKNKNCTPTLTINRWEFSRTWSYCLLPSHHKLAILCGPVFFRPEHFLMRWSVVRSSLSEGGKKKKLFLLLSQSPMGRSSLGTHTVTPGNCKLF